MVPGYTIPGFAVASLTRRFRSIEFAQPIR